MVLLMQTYLKNLHGLQHKMDWPLAMDSIKSIMGQGLSAVIYLHQQGIIHRDIKPTNFLMKSSRPLEILLADFGSASTSTKANTRCSTDGYSAPEVITGWYNNSVDVYSMGMTLLWLLNVITPKMEYRNEDEYDENLAKEVWDAIGAEDNVDVYMAIMKAESMVSYRPHDRPSADKVLESPWLSPWPGKSIYGPAVGPATTDTLGQASSTTYASRSIDGDATLRMEAKIANTKASDPLKTRRPKDYSNLSSPSLHDKMVVRRGDTTSTAFGLTRPAR